MKFVGYLRVSTEGQADGQGLDVQEDALRAWARKHRHTLVKLETDVGRSGADDVATRPGLARALAALQSGEAAGLVVYRLDRLARDMVLQEVLLARLARESIVVRSTSPAEDAYIAEDPDDPTRSLVRRILGAVSQYERDMIRLRLRTGKVRKELGGGFVGGKPPYGYRVVAGNLIPDPAEQAAVKLVLRLRAKGMSFEDIVDELDRRGMKTRKGTRWSRSALSRIVVRQANLAPTGKALTVVGGGGGK